MLAEDVSSDQAWSDDLVWVNPLDQTVHLRVSPDKNPSSGGRDTVKLVSKGMHDNGSSAVVSAALRSLEALTIVDLLVGLFIFDILRSPQYVLLAISVDFGAELTSPSHLRVCGAWPAVWMTSMTQEWPAGGEIDIVEYVSHQTE